MNRWLLTGGVFLLIGCFGACFNKAKDATEKTALAMYRQDIKDLAGQINVFLSKIESTSSRGALQEEFFEARKKYKQLEWLVEYYSPYTAKHINGPALQEVEPEDKAVVIQPEGFQVIETLLFPDYEPNQSETLLHQTRLLKSNIDRLLFTSATLETTDAHVFDALRLEVFRIIALGLAGFDSPVARNSIPEAASALKGLDKYAALYYKDHLNNNTAGYHLRRLFQSAQEYLKEQNDFNSFDHMAFFIGYLNPISQKLLLLQTELDIPFFKELRPLKATAATLFSKDIFDPNFYAPDVPSYATREKEQLGKKLFYDVRLSKNGKRSCASCHQPQRAFTDGLVKNNILSGNALLPRNTPTLINAALQPSLFYDARVSYLEDQAGEVISNKDEMHGSLAAAVSYLKKDTTYNTLFRKAYPMGKDVTESHIKNSIAAFVRSLVFLDSRFDKYMRGEKAAMDEREIRGFNLFMGKAKCGTCHFVPLFSGVNPPVFTKIDAEIIGVPATDDTLHARLDTDSGKYLTHKIPLHKNAFKTPTLRNIALTAPYMHNGVFKRLEDVIDFYDRGGGASLGLDLENQTLPTEKLNLSKWEKEAIVSFLETLTDTSSLN